MKLLPDLDTSWMGEPDPVRLALDRLGYYDERIVGKVEMKGRAKHFEIMYRRKGFGTVVVWYKEEKGVTLVEKFKEERY